MSIRSRLLLLVLLALLPPILLIGLRFFLDREREISAAVAALSSAADDVATELREKVQGTAQLHYGLARARDLTPPTAPPAPLSSRRCARSIRNIPAS